MRLKTVILFLCSVNALVASGAEPDADNSSKTIVRSFPASQAQVLQVLNKYGHMHFNTWSKDSVRFEILVTAKAPKSKDVQDMLNMTEIKFDQTGSKLSVSTKLESKLSFINQSLLDLSMSLNPGHKLEIEYVVYLPSSVQINVENKFGNIFLPDHKGAVNVKLSHGDLMAGDLDQLKYLDFKYGKATIGNTGNCDLTVQFATLEMKKVKDLKLNSTSSDIKIENVGSVWLTSRNDKIKMEKSGRFYGTSSFSNVQIDELDGSFSLNSKYGTVTIYKITADFKDFNAEGNYSTYNFYFDQNAGFSFSIRLQSGTGFNYPQSRIKVDDKTVQEDVVTYTGKTTTKSDGGSVRINMKSGKLFLG